MTTLELSDKDFRAVTMKMLQQAIMNTSKTIFKSRKSQQRNKRHREEPNEIFKLKSVTEIKMENK